MPEHENAARKGQEKAEPSRRSAAPVSQPVSQNLMAWDMTSYLTGEAPFAPPVKKHAAIISGASAEQRVNIARKLQQTYGNRYVQRLVESLPSRTGNRAAAGERTGKQPAEHHAAGAKRPLAAAVTPLIQPRLQLLRSGRAGRARFNETAPDLIAINLPFQPITFEEITAAVEAVIGQGFGSSRRRYADDPAFQSALREYLASLNHPSVSGGGPIMSRQRTLSFTVRLVRAGQRIQSVEFVQPVERVEVETPETVEASAPGPAPASGPGTPEPMSGNWESAMADIAGPQAGEGPEEAPAGPEPGNRALASSPAAEESTAARVVSGIETYADALSLRFVMRPVTAQMSEWEHQLEGIGGNLRSQPVAGIVLLPTITHLFVILQAIVGSIDLLLRVNVIVPRAASAVISLEAGLTTPEEFNQNLVAMGEEGLDILLLGLRQAAAHLRQGIQELNLFRIIQAQDEILLAILALLGIVRGIGRGAAILRESGAARPAGGAAAGGGEAIGAGETGTGLPAEAVEPPRIESAEPARPAGPSETPSSSGTSRPAGQVETSQTGGMEFGDTMEQPAVEPPRPAEPAAPAEQVESTRPAEPAGQQRARPTGGMPRIRRAITDPAEVRRLLDDYTRHGEGEVSGTFNFDPVELRRGWHERGGRGQAPLAYIDSNGRLFYNGEQAGLQRGVPAARSGATYMTESGQLRPLRERSAFTVEEARRLRDEHIRSGGGYSESYDPGSIQANNLDWQAEGGTGEPPLAYVDRQGYLRYDIRRVGEPSPEVLREGEVRGRGRRLAREAAGPRRLPRGRLAERLAQEAAERPPVQPFDEPQAVRDLLNDPVQQEMGIDPMDGAAYDQAWIDARQPGPAPQAGFISPEGRLVYNEQAVGSVQRTD